MNDENWPGFAFCSGLFESSPNKKVYVKIERILIITNLYKKIFERKMMMMVKTINKLFAAIIAFCVIISAAISAGAVDPDPEAGSEVYDAVAMCNRKIHDIEMLYSKWSEQKILNSLSRIRVLNKINIMCFKSVLKELEQSIKLSRCVSVKNRSQSQDLYNILDSVYSSLQKIATDDFNNNNTALYIADFNQKVESFEKFLKESPDSILKKIKKYFDESQN